MDNPSRRNSDAISKNTGQHIFTGGKFSTTTVAHPQSRNTTSVTSSSTEQDSSNTTENKNTVPLSIALVAGTKLQSSVKDSKVISSQESAFSSGLVEASNSLSVPSQPRAFLRVTNTATLLGNRTNMVKSSIGFDRSRNFRTQVEKAIREHKIYTCVGVYPAIRKALQKRGWVEKNPSVGITKSSTSKDVDARAYDDESDQAWLNRVLNPINPDFLWLIRRDNIDWRALHPNQIINRYPKAFFTTKVGIAACLQNIHWFTENGISETFFPRCYRLCMDEEKAGFIDDYRLTACIALLKWLIDAYESEGEKGVIDPQSRVSSLAVDFSIRQINNYVRMRRHEDIDWLMPPAFMGTHWDVFLNQYYNVVFLKAKLAPNDSQDTAKIKYEAAKRALARLAPFWPQLNIDGTNNIWICKPGARSRGKGIVIMNQLDKILELLNQSNCREANWVVQKYIERPLLIYKTKFDIRQWFIVADWAPLTVWFYKESYIRFCTKPFTLDDFHESLHLCNNAIQCRYENSDLRDSSLPDENMWDCYTFMAYLKTQGKMDLWDSLIYPGMKQGILGVLMASQETVDVRKNCFELYGADFMLSEDLTPWLIEINSCPCMSSTTSVTAKLCPQCLEDTIKVVIDRKEDRNADTGMFELIYKQNISTIPLQPFNGIELMIQGKKLSKDVDWPSIMTKYNSKRASGVTNSTRLPRTSHQTGLTFMDLVQRLRLNQNTDSSGLPTKSNNNSNNNNSNNNNSNAVGLLSKQNSMLNNGKSGLNSVINNDNNSTISSSSSKLKGLSETAQNILAQKDNNTSNKKNSENTENTVRKLKTADNLSQSSHVSNHSTGNDSNVETSLDALLKTTQNKQNTTLADLVRISHTKSVASGHNNNSMSNSNTANDEVAIKTGVVHGERPRSQSNKSTKNIPNGVVIHSNNSSPTTNGKIRPNARTLSTVNKNNDNQNNTAVDNTEKSSNYNTNKDTGGSKTQQKYGKIESLLYDIHTINTVECTILSNSTSSGATLSTSSNNNGNNHSKIIINNTVINTSNLNVNNNNTRNNNDSISDIKCDDTNLLIPFDENVNFSTNSSPESNINYKEKTVKPNKSTGDLEILSSNINSEITTKLAPLNLVHATSPTPTSSSTSSALLDSSPPPSSASLQNSPDNSRNSSKNKLNLKQEMKTKTFKKNDKNVFLSPLPIPAKTTKTTSSFNRISKLQGKNSNKINNTDSLQRKIYPKMYIRKAKEAITTQGQAENDNKPNVERSTFKESEITEKSTRARNEILNNEYHVKLSASKDSGIGSLSSSSSSTEVDSITTLSNTSQDSGKENALGNADCDADSVLLPVVVHQETNSVYSKSFPHLEKLISKDETVKRPKELLNPFFPLNLTNHDSIDDSNSDNNNSTNNDDEQIEHTLPVFRRFNKRPRTVHGSSKHHRILSHKKHTCFKIALQNSAVNHAALLSKKYLAPLPLQIINLNLN